MAQNMYDDPAFLARFWDLKKSLGHKPGGVPDMHTLASLLPPITNTRILDLGCGEGWFGRWALARGASSVHGVDRSQALVSRAQEEIVDDGRATFSVADLNYPADTLGTGGEYDLVFSSLAIHYMTDLPALFREVHKVLKPGGSFFFSVEHPMRTAPHKSELMTDASGEKYWPVAKYMEEGERVTNWLAEGVIKQHRTLGTYISEVLNAGLEIVSFREWAHRDSTGHFRNEKWFIPENVMPAFMMIGARRKDD
ncbi:methylase [Whalleya microplaca]|nr:methylase [Whalleya microplaca]